VRRRMMRDPHEGCAVFVIDGYHLFQPGKGEHQMSWKNSKII
jgi:hypothetical protein